MKSFVLFLTLINAFISSAQTIEKLTVEPNHSTIGFSVPIAGGLTRVTGKFTDYDMKFNYIDKDLTKSQVAFIIKASSITTDLKDRDDHLRNPDFFDVEKYPEIVFTSTQVKKKGKHFILRGKLIMHGIEKDIVLPLDRIAVTEKGVQCFQIRTKLNRKEYGVGNEYKHTLLENFVADEIEIEINLWTKKDKRS